MRMVGSGHRTLLLSAVFLFVIVDHLLWSITHLTLYVSSLWQGLRFVWYCMIVILALLWRVKRYKGPWFRVALRGISCYALLFGCVVAMAIYYALPSPQSLTAPENIWHFWQTIPAARAYLYPLACVLYLCIVARLLPRV